jgi:hypothetical protein
MMSNRDFIWLASTEAKCVPVGNCPDKPNCARFLVVQNGRPVGDYSRTGFRTAGVCNGFLLASNYRTPPASADRPYVTPKGLI